MNKDSFATYQQAVKLKELGFDENCYNFWSLEPDGKPLIITSTLCNVRNSDLKGRDITAPFLWQVQTWLREVKEIDVLVFNCACGYGWDISKAGNEQSRGTTIMPYDDNGEDEASGMWLSYEAALSAGISKCLTLLMENKI